MELSLKETQIKNPFVGLITGLSMTIKCIKPNVLREKCLMLNSLASKQPTTLKTCTGHEIRGKPFVLQCNISSTIKGAKHRNIDVVHIEMLYITDHYPWKWFPLPVVSGIGKVHINCFYIKRQNYSSGLFVVFGRRSPIRPPPIRKPATSRIGTAQFDSTRYPNTRLPAMVAVTTNPNFRVLPSMAPILAATSVTARAVDLSWVGKFQSIVPSSKRCGLLDLHQQILCDWKCIAMSRPWCWSAVVIWKNWFPQQDQEFRKPNRTCDLCREQFYPQTVQRIEPHDRNSSKNTADHQVHGGTKEVRGERGRRRRYHLLRK